MAAERLVIGGIVKNGVIMPEGDAKLPEGTRVEIVISASEIPPELLAELEAWERASDEAWAMIDQWEKEALACRTEHLTTELAHS
jgi:predicted DNA-binding antitoxin AbrB/MazE fold protein